MSNEQEWYEREKKVEKSCMSNSVKEEISGKNANGRVRWWIKRRSCKNLCIRGRLFSLFFLFGFAREFFLCLFFTCRHTILFYYSSYTFLSLFFRRSRQGGKVSKLSFIHDTIKCKIVFLSMINSNCGLPCN